jgi:O-methyltransferase involved in polyketide biosynthesis
VDRTAALRKQEGANGRRSPSRTATWIATLRAAHYLLDREPKILDDPFARALAGFSTDEELLKGLKALVYPDLARMRTLFALRNRYAEDELVRTIEHGTSQYIILARDWIPSRISVPIFCGR